MSISADLTRRFCQRWLQKAALYNPSHLEDAFDKFFTLFAVFNRLYFRAAQVCGERHRGDRQMATRLFPQVVGHEFLWQKLTADGGTADIQTLQSLIGPGGSFFLISGEDPDAPDPQRNADLRQRLGSRSQRIAVEAVLEYLYQVRCNMFHGNKGFEARQLRLLQPCLRCLERIIAAGLERLDDVA